MDLDNSDDGDLSDQNQSQKKNDLEEYINEIIEIWYDKRNQNSKGYVIIT